MNIEGWLKFLDDMKLIDEVRWCRYCYVGVLCLTHVRVVLCSPCPTRSACRSQNQRFTLQRAKLVFAWSRMQVKDDLLNRTKFSNITFTGVFTGRAWRGAMLRAC